MVLLSLVCNLTQALENREYIVGVYLDFSKASDMLDHMISLEKLYHCGVRDCAHDCFTIYVSIYLNSPTSYMFAQPFVQADNKRNINVPRYWSFVKANTVSMWWCHHVACSRWGLAVKVLGLTHLPLDKMTIISKSTF